MLVGALAIRGERGRRGGWGDQTEFDLLQALKPSRSISAAER